MTADRRKRRAPRGGDVPAKRSRRGKTVPPEGTLPAEDVELPPGEPCDVRDEPRPRPHPSREIHERRPAPRVPEESDDEPRRDG